MYAQETPTRPSQYPKWPGQQFIWDNLTTLYSRHRQNNPMGFPTRANINPELERQQMPAEEPDLPNPPRHSGWVRQPVSLPDNVYGDRAPVDILGNDSDDVFSGPSGHQRPGPSMAQHTELGTSSDLTQKSDIMAKMVWEGGAKLFNLLLKKAAVPIRSPSGKPSREVPNVRNVCEWHYRDLMRLPKDAQEKWKTACLEVLESRGIQAH